MHPVRVIPGMFKLQVGMNQAEDQRFRFLRETGWHVVACSKKQQPELTLLCSLLFTQTQPALGLPDKIWRNEMDWGIQRQRNTVHSKEVKDVGDTMLGW